MSNERANGDGGADALSYFMSRIAEHEILDREDEYQLGSLIQRGLRAEEALLEAEETDIFTSDEERDTLLCEVEEGRRARNELVLHNQRLVVSIAKKYTSRAGTLELIDLIQYGTEGLMKAAEKFDPEKGYKFSTYSIWWITAKIQKGLKQGSHMMLSHRDTRYIGNVQGASIELGENGGRASDADVSEELSLPLSTVQRIRKFSEVFSLDAQLMGIDNHFSLNDALPSYDGGYEEVDSLDFFVDCLSVLDEEEEELFLLRLDLHPEHTFPDVRRRNGLLGLEYTGSVSGYSRQTTANKLDDIYAKIILHLRTTEQFDENIEALIARKISHEQSDK